MDQRTRVLLAAVVGAGVVIGTAGVFLYNQLYNERRRLLVQENEIHKLDQTVAELKAELQAVQAKQRSKRSTNLRRSRSNTTVDTESDFDMYSAIGTDDEDEEFFDISDDDDEKYGSSPDAVDDPVLAQLFATCDVLLSGPAEDKRTARSELMDHLEVYPECPGLLWRLAKSASGMATVHGLEGDLDKKKEVVTQGVNFASRALALDPECAEAHKWYAVLVGTRGEFQGMKEKIEDGFVFRQHVDKALALNPSDASLYHLLGRFKYEVAALSWIERKLASTLFAEPPSATYNEAISDFEQAEKLSPAPWKENRLLLAKCHIGQGDYSSAVCWLDKATQVAVKTPDDEAAHREAENLSSKYSSYRDSL